MRHHQKRRIRPLILAVSLILLLAAGTGGTLAFLIDRTDPVENVFTPGRVVVEVTEDFNKAEKKNVQIQNTVNTDAYIRAVWVANWVDSEGNIVAPALAAEYTVTGTGENWFQKDGYWYYAAAVAPGASTTNLIDALKPVNGACPDGAHLQVIILSQAVQSQPADALAAAEWPVTINDAGNLAAE